MPIVAYPGKREFDDSQQGVLSWPMYVVDTEKGTLDPFAARDEAIAEFERLVGVPPTSAPFREESKSRVIVETQLASAELIDILVQQAGPDPVAPRIVDETIGQILPPQPFELVEAHETLQSVGATPTRLLQQTITEQSNGEPVAGRNRIPIYPPQQNLTRRLTVPSSLLTDDYFFALSNVAHRLNSNTVAIKGRTFAPQTVMLLTSTLNAGGVGGGVLSLGYAVGQLRSISWERTTVPGGISVPETLPNAKPFSRITYNQKIIPPLGTTPGRIEQYAAFEHRVYELADLRYILPAPQPDDD